MTDDKAHDQRLAQGVFQGGRLATLLLELWQRTRMDWGFVTDRLAQAFRRERWLGAHDRRVVAETLYGMVRYARTIDAGLGGTAVQDTDRIAAYFLLTNVLAPDALPDGRDWLRVKTTFDKLKTGSLRDQVALGESLPDWLADQLIADVGERALPLALALNQRAPMTVRTNLLWGTRDALLAALGQEGLEAHAGKHSPWAVTLTSRTNLFGTRAFDDGAFEAQDEGSQLLAELAVPDKPGTVLDYCAGAGGKTLAIGAALHNRGRLVATDIDEKKLTELRRRGKRAGLTNINAVSIEKGRTVLDAITGKAHIVLVDAPCTGIGALRRNPESRWRISKSDVAQLVNEQRDITRRAASYVAPGGRLIYATCSVLRAENEGNAAWLTDALATAGFVPERLDGMWGTRARQVGDGMHFSVAPDTHGTDGFFAACFVRQR